MKNEKARAETSDRLYQLLEQLRQTRSGSLAQRISHDIRQFLAQLQVEYMELADQTEALRREQENLGAAREQYRELYESAPVGDFTLDPSGLILGANRTGAGLLGAAPGDLLNTNFPAYVAPDSRASFVSYCQRAWARRTRQVCELNLQATNGRVFPARLEGLALPEDERGGGRLRLAVSEATDPGQAASSGSESEQRFKALFDHASDGILLADMETKQLYKGNPAACQMLGYRQEEIATLGVQDIHPPEALSCVLEQFEGQAQGELTLAQDIPVQRSDGTVLYADVNAFHITWGGKPYLAGVFRDVTKRKQREDLLCRTVTRLEDFENIINLSPAMIFRWRVAEGWPVEFVSENVRQLGYTAQDLRSGRVSWPGITHPEDHQRLQAEVAEYFQKGVDSFTQQYRLITKAGDIRWVEDWNQVLRDGQGVVRHVYGLVWDITERKRVEQQRERLLRRLASEHRRFAAVLQYMPAGVIIAEAPSGKIVLSNDQVAQTWAHPVRPADNIAQYDQYQGFHPDGRPYRPEEWPLARAIQQGEVVIDEEIAIRRGDGSPGTILASAMPIRDRRWQIYAAVVIFRDITEHKRAALALQTSEEKYRQLFRTVSDAIMVFDAETRQFLEVNEAAVRLYGYSRQEFLQLRHAAITAEPEQSAASFQQTLAGELDHIPLRYHKKKDGTVFPVEISASTFTLGQRRLFCGITRDITERLHTQKALRESEQKFRTLADESPNMIFINCQGRLVYVNKKCAELMGYTREEFYAADFDFLGLHAPESRAMAQQHFTRHRQGQEVRPCEYTLLTKDGRRLEALLTSTLIRYDGGQAILGIVIDITERKRLEREILDISAREQSRIGQDLHDDLGQVLTGMAFLTETLKQRLAQKSPGDVSPMVAQLAQWVSQALAKTRSLAKVLCPVQLESDGLSRALETLAGNTQEIFGVSCQYHGQQPPVVVEDNAVAGHLYRIAQEALTNAVKHAQASRIAMGLQAVGDGDILLTVEDDGVGLPEDFHQAAGMGLRIMGYRAAVIGAHLDIRPSEPHGTCVQCRLPSRKASQ